MSRFNSSLSPSIPLLLTSVLTCCTPPEPHSGIITNPQLCATGQTATVIKIIDGDTITVEFPDGKMETVRYIGIDTPEFGERCFNEAKDKNMQLLRDPRIRLVRDTSNRDRYGRLVRYVCSFDNTFIDAQLVVDGFAEAFRFSPDVRYADYFSSLEKTAIKNATGCLHKPR